MRRAITECQGDVARAKSKPCAEHYQAGTEAKARVATLKGLAEGQSKAVDNSERALARARDSAAAVARRAVNIRGALTQGLKKQRRAKERVSKAKAVVSESEKGLMRNPPSSP